MLSFSVMNPKVLVVGYGIRVKNKEYVQATIFVGGDGALGSSVSAMPSTYDVGELKHNFRNCPE